MKKNITSYQDLLIAKDDLKDEISAQEFEIKNNKFLKFSSTVISGKPLKNKIFDTISSVELKDIITSPLGNLLSTYLLSNKTIRKYFVAYTILKETVPYAFQKLKDILDQQSETKD